MAILRLCKAQQIDDAALVPSRLRQRAILISACCVHPFVVATRHGIVFKVYVFGQFRDPRAAAVAEKHQRTACFGGSNRNIIPDRP